MRVKAFECVRSRGGERERVPEYMHVKVLSVCEYIPEWETKNVKVFECAHMFQRERERERDPEFLQEKDFLVSEFSRQRTQNVCIWKPLSMCARSNVNNCRYVYESFFSDVCECVPER